jgi:hypothetical protein
MAEIFSTIKPLSNLTGISKPDGSFKLHSENLSSINFDGKIAKRQIKTKVSDLKAGQTILVSDPSYSSSSVYITKIESRAGFINDDANQPTTKYYVYHLSEFSMEQPFTYNATYGDSYSADAELNVLRDDVENFVIGNDGWALTNNGNAIFSNVFARGTIEATSGKIDGNLEVGTNPLGGSLVTIGSDLFDGKVFESIEEKHSGILLDANNYLLSYPSTIQLPVTSVVATDSSVSGFLYSATFTIPLGSGEVNTLQVGDFIKLSGFTHANTTALNTTHQVSAVTPTTFTIPISYDINLTSPVTINVSMTSFALIKTYNLTSMTLVSIPDTVNSSTVKLYLSDSDYFIIGTDVTLTSFLGDLSSLNGVFKIIGKGEGYISVYSKRITAGTYTSSLGSIVLYSKVQKFKVGDNFNFMSFSSETGSLKLTGTINANSGNFTNQVYVGQAATTFYIFRKKLASNIATLSTTEAHSFSVGDIVTVEGVDATFNGTYTVKQTPTALTFTYDKIASPVTEIDLVEYGYVSSDSSVDGTIKVGVADTGITIDGTGDPLTSAIYAGEGNFKNADTGFFMDASGRFSIADKLYFENGNLTISGTVTANAFAIDANNYWNTTGNEGDFRVGSATSYLFWNQTNSPNAGDGNLEVKGTINATAGIFSGNIQTTGKIYSGTLDSGGLLTSGIEVASTGIKGIIGGIASFVLPADGVTKPTITNFEVLNAQITGDKTNAFLVAGDVGVSANNVVVRGYRGGTDQTAAIYNTKNGTATTYAGGTGFYLNDNGFFKVGTDTSNAKFDPTANSNAGLFSVTGEIKATSGYIGGTVSGWLINSSRITNDAGLFGAGLIATSAPIVSYNLAQNPQAAGNGTSLGLDGIPGFFIKQSNNIRCGPVNNGSYSISAPFSSQYRYGELQLQAPLSVVRTMNGSSGSTTLVATTTITGISVGNYVSGTGIPQDTVVLSFDGSQTITVSNPLTTTGSRTVTFQSNDYFYRAATGASGQLTITTASTPFSIQPGFYVSGTGIAENSTVVSVVGTTVTLSAANTATVTGNILFSSSAFPIISTYGGSNFTTYTFNTGQYMLSAYFYVTSASPFVGKQVTLRATGSLVSSHWENLSFSPVTLVGGSWVRATTLVNMTTAGAGSPLVTATINGLKTLNVAGGQIFTSSWMISPGNTLQDYFDETFPMGVDAGGYSTKYEQVLYSGSTYNSRSSAALQLGHGGNIYATVGKIGGFNLASNQLYIDSPLGNFSLGDLSSGGDYPEYGLSINASNVWKQGRFQMEQNFTLMNSDVEPAMIQIDSASGSIYYDADGGTEWSPADNFGGGYGGSITLGHITDPDNFGLYHQVSGITSNYYNIVGSITGSTYLYQGNTSTWYMGPNLAVRGTLSSNALSSSTSVGGSTGSFSSSVTANTFYAPNWFRSTGDSGWYSETYGGGIYMIDTTWIRTYGGKNFYSDAVIRAQGGLISNSGMTVEGNITITNGSIIANGTGTGTSRLQTLDMDGHIYGSGVMYDNVITGRTMRIAASPYIFGTAGSSRRIKSYIDPIDLTDELISKYLQIQPVSYFYNAMVEGVPETELEGKVREIGLIAEDLQDLGFFGLINVDDEGIADYVHYDKISIYNIKMIQMQQERINQLENRLAALES